MVHCTVLNLLQPAQRVGYNYRGAVWYEGLTVSAASWAIEEYSEGVEGGGAEGVVNVGGGAGDTSFLEDEDGFFWRD